MVNLILSWTKRALIVGVSMAVTFSVAAQTQSLTVGFGYNKAPFVISQTEFGIEISIMREVLENMGYDLKVLHLNNNDLHDKFDDFNLDAAATVRKQYSSSERYYSDDFIEFDNVAIHKRKGGIVLETVSDLLAHKVGAWSLAKDELGQEFNDISELLDAGQYWEFKDQEKQNLAFWNNDIEVIIIDLSIFKWYQRKLSTVLDSKEEVVVSKLFKKSTPFKVAFKDKQIRDLFNIELADFRNSPRYTEIFLEYLHLPVERIYKLQPSTANSISF